MASSYSDILRFELIGAGEQAGLWGETTNNNLGTLVEQAIAGVTTVTLSGGAGSVTLTALNGAPDQSRSAVLKFVGVPSGQKDIIIPTKTKLYVVRNDCGQTITIKTAAQVTGVTILDGEATLVFCDGTNAVAGIATAGVGPTTVANGGTGATSFVGGFIKSPGGTGTLTSSATVNLATEVTGTLPVANGGTGANNASTARTNLGLGTVSTINTNGSTTQFLRGDGTFATPATSSGVTSVSGSGNISVSPTTGSPVVSITSTPTFSTVYYGNTSNYITQSSNEIAFIAGGFQTAKVTNQGIGCNALASSGIVTTNPGVRYGSTWFIGFDGGSNLNFDYPQNSTKVQMQASGSVFNLTGTYAAFSDARIKENIVTAPNYLDKLCQLNVVNFNFINDDKKMLGFVAQEVEQVLPGPVEVADIPNYPDIPDLKAVKTSILIPMLVQAVQELKAELDEAKAEIAALKAQ